ncbi:MAG TPA: SDR family oxidoreductase [Acidimicrobiia bacterium]|nr:SDR family oxidoreductase [Acidimicrobiia bacterium]
MTNGSGSQRRFEGKVALLTGAASGMGRAIAQRLAAEGAHVHGLDVDADGLAETAKLVADAGGQMSTRRTDVSSRDECFAAVGECSAELGRIDVLGNIAGIARAEHFTDVTEAQYRQMMGVNIDGYFFMAQAAIPHLLESGGNIVNIASNAGLMGQAYTVVYCITKGAVVQFTRALAIEYIKTPLRVNALAPSGVETPLATGFQVPPDVDGELMQRIFGFRPMAQPEEIAALFAFVASDEARNIHGAVISSDSGLTAG